MHLQNAGRNVLSSQNSVKTDLDYLNRMSQPLVGQSYQQSPFASNQTFSSQQDLSYNKNIPDDQITQLNQPNTNSVRDLEDMIQNQNQEIQQLMNNLNQPKPKPKKKKEKARTNYHKNELKQQIDSLQNELQNLQSQQAITPPQDNQANMMMQYFMQQMQMNQQQQQQQAMWQQYNDFWQQQQNQITKPKKKKKKNSMEKLLKELLEKKILEEEYEQPLQPPVNQQEFQNQPQYEPPMYHAPPPPPPLAQQQSNQPFQPPPPQQPPQPQQPIQQIQAPPPQIIFMQPPAQQPPQQIYQQPPPYYPPPREYTPKKRRRSSTPPRPKVQEQQAPIYQPPPPQTPEQSESEPEERMESPELPPPPRKFVPLIKPPRPESAAGQFVDHVTEKNKNALMTNKQKQQNNDKEQRKSNLLQNIWLLSYGLYAAQQFQIRKRRDAIAEYENCQEKAISSCFNWITPCMRKALSARIGQDQSLDIDIRNYNKKNKPDKKTLDNIQQTVRIATLLFEGLTDLLTIDDSQNIPEDLIYFLAKYKNQQSYLPDHSLHLFEMQRLTFNTLHHYLYMEDDDEGTGISQKKLLLSNFFIVKLLLNFLLNPFHFQIMDGNKLKNNPQNLQAVKQAASLIYLLHMRTYKNLKVDVNSNKFYDFKLQENVEFIKPQNERFILANQKEYSKVESDMQKADEKAYKENNEHVPSENNIAFGLYEDDLLDKIEDIRAKECEKLMIMEDEVTNILLLKTEEKYMQLRQQESLKQQKENKKAFDIIDTKAADALYKKFDVYNDLKKKTQNQI